MLLSLVLSINILSVTESVLLIAISKMNFLKNDGHEREIDRLRLKYYHLLRLDVFAKDKFVLEVCSRAKTV